MKQYLSLLLLFLTLNLFSQTKTKIFIGAEMGLNINQSDYIKDSQNITMQAGILSEYVLNKHFSIMGKLKYYESAVRFNYSRVTGSNWFGTEYDFVDAEYKGKILSIPLTFRYNFRIINKISGSVGIGPSLNYELSSIYNYPTEVNKNFSRTFIGLNTGFNFNYNIGKSTVFVGFEPYYGAKRGSRNGKGFYSGNATTITYPMENMLLNIGVKYKLK